MIQRNYIAIGDEVWIKSQNESSDTSILIERNPEDNGFTVKVFQGYTEDVTRIFDKTIADNDNE